MASPRTTATLLVDSRCTLGEGILWSARRNALLWTDIQRSQLWMHSALDESTESWRLPDRLGSFAICASGRLLLGLANALFLGDIDAARGPGLPADLVVPVEPDVPSTRINDGRTDRAGNFVFGTMNELEGHAPIGSFYQYSTRHGLRRLDLGGVGIPNSICFSLDGRTMYYCDSPTRRIMQCEYDADTAAVANAREFVRYTDEGQPDGSIIDGDGCLWNAVWGAAVVRRFTPGGILDREVAAPATNLTCVCFGGDALDELYVTSSRQEMSDADLARMPDAGGIYRAIPGDVRGVPEVLFRDLL